MIPGRHTVLCVDDEQFVVASLARLLRHDYNVLTATSGEDALALVQHHKVDVLVSDQRMPGMKGVDLLRRVKESSPATMRILLTGYADLNAIVDSVNEGEVFRYITKPWKNEVLRYTVNVAAKAAAETVVQQQQIAALPIAANDLNAMDPTKDIEQIDILVIDTDTAFHEQVRRACSHKGKLYHATSMDSALRILEAHPNIGVVISETRVGSDDVTALVSALKTYHPTVTSIVASGYSDANAVIRLINQGQIYRFLPKPTDEARIEEAVTRAGKMHRSLRQSTALVQRFQVEASGEPDAAELVAAPEARLEQAASTPAERAAPAQQSSGATQRIFNRIKALFAR
jgi:response regulator RpfG family c-di-GMP phosphodiesterase